MPLIDEPIYTVEVAAHEFSIPSGATFLYGSESDEARAVPSPRWFSHLEDDQVYRQTLDVDTADNLVVSDVNGGVRSVVSLYDLAELSSFLDALPQPVYLDITGLTHRIWAPLIRGATQSSADIRVVYLEPSDYLRRSFRDAQRIYDLSEKFDGLRPLPGFAVLGAGATESSDGLFVPMVGFEGSRLEYVLTHSEADLRRTYPIIGVPGFRPDYAFYAYQGNRRSFEKEFLHTRVQMAKANCPFEAFYLLREIQSWTDAPTLRIAPIGTKPHALGAVLFALANPSQVELIYDNPVRAQDRTSGQARILIYALSAFMASNQFRRLLT